MRVIAGIFAFAPVLLLFGSAAYAVNYADTTALFRKAGDSAVFFSKSYGYAVFPTVGEAGFIVDGARGKGRVYAQGKLVGDVNDDAAECRLPSWRQGIQPDDFLRGQARAR
jgi:hypothetical protein